MNIHQHISEIKCKTINFMKLWYADKRNRLIPELANTDDGQFRNRPDLNNSINLIHSNTKCNCHWIKHKPIQTESIKNPKNLLYLCEIGRFQNATDESKTDGAALLTGKLPPESTEFSDSFWNRPIPLYIPSSLCVYLTIFSNNKVSKIKQANNEYNENEYDNEYDDNEYDDNEYDDNEYDDNEYDNNEYDDNEYDDNEYNEYNEYDEYKYEYKYKYKQICSDINIGIQEGIENEKQMQILLYWDRQLANMNHFRKLLNDKNEGIYDIFTKKETFDKNVLNIIEQYLCRPNSK
jgi:hypothetical protein